MIERWYVVLVISTGFSISDHEMELGTAIAFPIRECEYIDTAIYLPDSNSREIC